MNTTLTRHRNQPRPCWTRVRRGIISGSLLVLLPVASAQTNRWTAYNDHRPTPPPGVNGWFTAPNVTTYDFYNTPSGGPLINRQTGQALPAIVQITRSSAGVRDMGTAERPFGGTPAEDLFHGIADMGGNGIVGLEPGGWVSITFTNLDPSKRYLFLGTTVRGGNYLDRWTVCTISNAASWTDAHSGIGGSNVITRASFHSAPLYPNQVAWCSGENRAAGDVIGWEDIDPGPDGAFSVISEIYRGLVPGGQNTTAAPYAYALSVFLMAEQEIPPMPITILQQPPPETTVTELLPFTLDLTVQGSSPSYQWFKIGAGAITGATLRAYSVAQAALADAGKYYVVISNSFGAMTSSIATVNVLADTMAPTVLRIWPRVNPVILEITFSEPVNPGSAQDPLAYIIAGMHPLAATLDAAGVKVILSLPRPLAFDSTNTLSVTGIADRASEPNVMPLTELQVRAPALARGYLRADYYTDIIWHYVDALLSNPKFPDLYDRTLYRTSSTSQQNFGDNYGLRLWGFFIPPTNGNYTFYVRSDDECQVYLSRSTDPVAKLPVASQTGSSRPYDDQNGSPRFSTVTGLIAGQLYYFEALLKEGGGEDYITVVYKAEGEPAPIHNTISVTPIPSSSLACYADAQDVSVEFTKQPVRTNLLQFQRATFSVSANAVPAELASLALYQWQCSTGAGYTNIPGATARTFATPPLTLADHGGLFRCQVTVPGATAISIPATVTVSPSRPSIWVALEGNGTNLLFRLSTVSGAGYLLESTDTLSPPNWQPLTTVQGTGGQVNLSAPVTAAPNRFFRIKLE